jgi:hypothetical protein
MTIATLIVGKEHVGFRKTIGRTLRSVSPKSTQTARILRAGDAQNYGFKELMRSLSLFCKMAGKTKLNSGTSKSCYRTEPLKTLVYI